MRAYILISLLFINVQSNWGQEAERPEPAILELSKFVNIRDFSLSASGEEAYFSLQSPLGEISAIMRIKRNGDTWSDPVISSFSGGHNDLEPFLSPDNLKLYFASDRPLNTSDASKKDYDIWVVSRASLSAQWSEPVNLGSPVNSEKNEFYPSVASNGNLYFTSDLDSSKGKDDIFLSSWDGSTYKEPVSLGEAINSEGYEFNAFIAPDESSIIFSGYNRQDGMGSGDLYISYHHNKVWEKAVNMGELVNSDKMDYCPFIDIGSMTLYFTSKRSTVKVGKSYTDVTELLKEIQKYENGQSRLYKVKIDKLRSNAD